MFRIFSRPTAPPAVLYEQVRNFWGKEGRIGWRRKKRMEMEQRLKILNPISPVTDYYYPLPKNDLESLPSDLFEKAKKELTLEEQLEAKNTILECINKEVSSESTGRLFGVVNINLRQFKVTPEDIIVIQDHFVPSVGDQIRLHKVLMVGNTDFTLVGRPLLDQDMVRIEATVIEKTFSYTKMHFVLKKGEDHRRTKFSKTPLTMLRINLIEITRPLEMITSDTLRFNQHRQI